MERLKKSKQLNYKPPLEIGNELFLEYSLRGKFWKKDIIPHWTSFLPRNVPWVITDMEPCKGSYELHLQETAAWEKKTIIMICIPKYMKRHGYLLASIYTWHDFWSFTILVKEYRLYFCWRNYSHVEWCTSNHIKFARMYFQNCLIFLSIKSLLILSGAFI